MRFAHTGDLHIGKRLYEHSLLSEQEQMLEQMLDILVQEAVDALIIAGDIYDKPTPAADAVRLFDDFVYKVSEQGIRLFVISGNHDSMERISFGSRIMQAEGVYFQENFEQRAQKIVLQDAHGSVYVYMVPFMKPVYMNMDSYEDAFAAILEQSEIDYTQRNVLVAHQFVTGTRMGENADMQDLDERGLLPVRSESESIHVGGLDNISYELVRQFDYVALGHLHRRQCIGEEHIRYAGSPFPYSFSEGNDSKSIEIVDICEKGNVEIHSVSLEPVRGLRTIKGTLEHLTSDAVVYADGVSREDYICAVITDRERVSDAAGKLFRWYPNLLRIEYQTELRDTVESEIAELQGKSPAELFAEYYESMSGKPLADRQRKIVEEILGGDMCETD